MKFLLDANLSPLIALQVSEAGYTVTHVRDLGLRHATDEQIMDYAAENGMVVISQDSDFTNLLFYRKASRPSLVLLRDTSTAAADEIADLLVNNLPQLEESLTKGAVASVFGDRIRVHHLPFS